MTDNINTPQDTQIHKLALSDEYKENAMNKVKKMVKGNKFPPEDVKLEKLEGEILHFQAENMLTILTKVSHKKIGGRIEGPVQVSNESAVNVAMNNEYTRLSQNPNMERTIREVLLNRDDQGFALDNNIIPLPFWKKEFVTYEPCQTCKSTGTVKCHPCAGKGIDQCPRCNGSGMGHCGHCNGAQMIQGPQGNQVQCPVCHGNGHISCTTCNQSGTVQCTTCRSKGITACPNCKGNAWISTIYTQTIEARTAFDYPKNRLPEKIVAMIEKYGVKIREHANIKISEDMLSAVNLYDTEKAKKASEDDRKNNYRIPIIYEVFLPYGHMEYNIKGKNYYTFLFGTQERLIHVSPFLDDLIKNGLRKLSDAAEKRGDVGKNLVQAAEYRTIKEGIFYTTMHSLAKAKTMLMKSNSLGLSSDVAKDIIKDTDTALKNITKKPRITGLILSAIFNIALFCTYFLSPARNMLTALIPNQNLHIIFDLLTLTASTYLGIIIIQIISSAAIKQIIERIGIKKASQPKLGDTLYWTIGLSILSFIGALELSRVTNIFPPFWYINLF
ncbi:MAG: hypothetical protein COB14_03470 [Alphaproteobacteria bacterium]|nr:MAG: hypothetical protein COB14_03470 [Alphaproteobacteria bacterium]